MFVFTLRLGRRGFYFDCSRHHLSIQTNTRTILSVRQRLGKGWRWVWWQEFHDTLRSF